MDDQPSIFDINSTSELPRYFCHSCLLVVTVTEDFKCMRCSGGFVEEINEQSSPELPRILRLMRRIEAGSPPSESPSPSPSPTPTPTPRATPTATSPSVPPTPPLIPLTLSRILRNASSTSPSIPPPPPLIPLALSRILRNARSSSNMGDTEESPSRSEMSIASVNLALEDLIQTSSDTGNPDENEVVPIAASEAGAGAGARAQNDNFGDILMNVFVDVLDVLGASNMDIPIDRPQTSRRGIFTVNSPTQRTRNVNVTAASPTTAGEREVNPNNPLNAFFEFAFGPAHGLNGNINLNDSQNHELAHILMNTLNHLLPPISIPISNECLERITKIEIAAEDLENQNICAICWDEFQLREPVRKLPCAHFFHEACVFPWLKLHRTCPLCRGCFIKSPCLGVASNSQGNGTPSRTETLLGISDDSATPEAVYDEDTVMEIIDGSSADIAMEMSDDSASPDAMDDEDTVIEISDDSSDDT